MQLIHESALKHPEKTAISFEGTAWTFAAFDREVSRYAAALSTLGISKGDRVALQLPKQMEFLFLHFAALCLGAISLPLNSDYQPEEIHYFLTDSQSALFITDRHRYHRCQTHLHPIQGLQVLLVDGQEDGTLYLGGLINSAPKNFNRPYAGRGDDTAMICYTSGTTGRSKGAMITHENLISNSRALAMAWQWTENDVLLHVLPLFHVHGLNVATVGSLLTGASIHMHDKFTPARAWDAIEQKHCTLFMAVPTIYQRLVNEWEIMETKPDLSSMRVFISGSAPLSDNLFHRFEQTTGFRILERYGMTETGMNSSNLIDPAGRKAKSVGFPLPGISIRVVGTDGADVPLGTVGEVWIKGPNVFSGYWRMPEKTAESFSGEWFKSGDLGYLDPADGNRLYLAGRAKELIISGGYNVYPKEIENVLESHAAVGESAVIGLADEDLGERVTAAVVIKQGASVTAKELIDLCKSRLAGYKCPKQIHFLEALPRNAMGKIQKNILSATLPPNGVAG
jgi:malonyl-CoA/methylmalonyl-CoA synthetase